MVNGDPESNPVVNRRSTSQISCETLSEIYAHNSQLAQSSVAVTLYSKPRFGTCLLPMVYSSHTHSRDSFLQANLFRVMSSRLVTLVSFLDVHRGKCAVPAANVSDVL